jgi:hypothetical protein
MPDILSLGLTPVAFACVVVNFFRARDKGNGAANIPIIIYTLQCVQHKLTDAIAHAAIEEETRYSVCAKEAFRLYLKTQKEKE